MTYILPNDIHSTRTPDLISRLDYQAQPGTHTFCDGSCQVCGGHSRGGRIWCAKCIDTELLRRFIDVTKVGSQFAYERVDGRIRRKTT
jgi:hypothetical protein